MSTLDKKLIDITEGAAMDASGEKSLGAAPACEPQQDVPALEARNLMTGLGKRSGSCSGYLD